MRRMSKDEPIERKTLSATKTLWDMVREYQQGEMISREMEAVRRLVIEGYRAWKRKGKKS